MKIGEKISVPGIGVVTITKTTPKLIATADRNKNIIVFINRYRPLIHRDQAQLILDNVNNFSGTLTPMSPLFARYPQYMETIFRGDLVEISALYKSLVKLGLEKELSLGERKILSRMKEIIEEELSAVLEKNIIL